MSRLLEAFGGWMVAAMITLESAGAPVPGETILVTSAIYAGTKQTISIFTVIVSAFVGAVLGNVIGYGIGRFLGYRLLVRYGSYIWLTRDRLKIGQYLFRRYGIVVLVISRFLPVLRSAAAPLAGANRMPFGNFLLGTGIGGAIWVTAIAVTAYMFGEEMKHLSTPIMIGVSCVAAAFVATAAILIARNEKSLEVAANKSPAVNN
jgi:membrane protein DedA with SNARE-associated domain